jgi:oxygen-independent coproporphyrinogen-3 oxidase
MSVPLRSTVGPDLPALTLTPGTAFGIYVHVPFCATRCGYCDFNTYTASELGDSTPDGWLAALRTELALAADRVGPVAVDTVSVGGGTPSLLGVGGLRSVLDGVRDNFPLAADAEITTEANPESTSPEFFEGIRAAGFTRVSLGMQSASARVLAVLDRTHSPGRAVEAVREARSAGFAQVNIDLIYGTPGESDDDLARSAEAALAAGVDHVSAYALVVEDGTALQEARALAAVLAAKPPRILKMAREYFLSELDDGYRKGVKAAVENFCNVAATAESKAGIQAFVERQRKR